MKRQMYVCFDSKNIYHVWWMICERMSSVCCLAGSQSRLSLILINQPLLLSLLSTRSTESGPSFFPSIFFIASPI